MKKNSRFQNLIEYIKNRIYYYTSGVWNDPRQTMGVRLLRTINLSVNSFLDRGLQIRSMSMTYSTVLALVPAIALLVAIGRGFGLQNYLQDELYNFFPSQHRAISAALSFVDSYLNQASQGVFVGAGIIFLLWTVISLLSYIEDAFNFIWDIKAQRSFFQKITDYISICLIIPVLMICSSGVSIFMSTTVQDNLYFPFLTPVVNTIMELVPFFLCWIAFSLCYLLIPNTKVEIKYAAISGMISAIIFQILQLLFVNGQIYVSKYNAIYGSFAFLPLLLIWLQFSWLILLAGCVLTYSLQNVFTFNFNGNSEKLSLQGWRSVALIVMGVISKLYIEHKRPLTNVEIAVEYSLPIRLVNNIMNRLHKAKLTYTVKLDNGSLAHVPAVELQNYSVGEFLHTIDSTGDEILVDQLRALYPALFETITPIRENTYELYSNLLIRDLPLPSPEQIQNILIAQAQQLSKMENKA